MTLGTLNVHFANEQQASALAAGVLRPQLGRGYYHEYTVPTPGAPNRGARRVIRGNKGETYYTNDHYQSFIRLDG
jgi:guanyl-specific ribonuclease Sa